jgi:hypothetical protein
MKKNCYYALALAIFLVTSGCNKEAGPGGTSSITGYVNGKDHQFAQAEITEIIFTAGSEVEHGDYWILNTPNNGTQYYVWYDNPTWISNGDPQLAGRTGIPVSFNYSDSNSEIADNTLNALNAVLTPDFSMSLTNDVLILTNTSSGYVPDANNMISPFEFNIADQGSDATLSTSTPSIDEHVYLVYGANKNYGESVKTGGDGEFRFDYLTKGTYTVYVVSKDTTTQNGAMKEAVTLEIADNKSVVSLSAINVLY